MDEKLMTLPVDCAQRADSASWDDHSILISAGNKSISAVEHAMVGEQKVFLVTQRQIRRRRIPMPPDLLPDRYHRQRSSSW